MAAVEWLLEELKSYVNPIIRDEYRFSIPKNEMVKIIEQAKQRTMNEDIEVLQKRIEELERQMEEVDRKIKWIEEKRHKTLTKSWTDGPIMMFGKLNDKNNND